MKRILLLTMCGAALGALPGHAAAGIIGNPITVTVQNDSGVGTFSIALSDCTWDPGSQQWYYIQQGSRTVMSNDGRPLPTFNGLTMFMQDDPSISLGFALQGGSTPTLVTIAS